MKILYIINSLRSGGKERRLISLMQGLLKLKAVQISLVLLSEEIHYQQVKEMDINISVFARDIRKDFKIIYRFNKILQVFKPDVVHCWDNIAALNFGPLCKFKGIPFINSMISAAPDKLSYFSKRYLSNAISYPFSDVVLSNSRAGLVSFRVPLKKAEFIHNGFDIDRINVKESAKSVSERLEIKTKKVIGMTASFSKMKDYFTFVKAANILLKKRKDVTFVTIGDGLFLNEIINSISPMNKQYFRFLGKQSDVESIVNIFDIGVLSTYTEGISNAIMEYMSLSKPVIATDGGGTSELVLDGETGFLINKQDEEVLAQKMEYLLNHSDRAKEMGVRGKTRIINHFSLEKMIDETFRLYKKHI